ncbi:lyase family protein, partial [Kitasatospora sp. NPDC049258]|uniref:lyase family protein n=1 Tax=Kitasatospora sp. NPDC049258 TaxID=3155394 RepID=UPI0034335724
YLAYAHIDNPHTDPTTYHHQLTHTYAQETGLTHPTLPWHALRTPIADLATTLAHTTGALGKIAIDVQTLNRTEIAELTEPTTTGRGTSSAMPHKRNPVLSTLIRSAALQIPALTTTLTQCLLTEDERSAGTWHAEWHLLRETLRLTGGAAHTAAELTEGLQPHPHRMRTNLDLTAGQIVSEHLTAHLTPHLGKTTAKNLLTHASTTAHHTGRPLPHVLADHPQITEHLTPDQLTHLCDPTTYTGAAPTLVDHALDERRPAGPAPTDPPHDRP